MARKSTKKIEENMNLDITELFRQTIENQKLGVENVFTPTYSVGMDILDYYNGKSQDNEIILGVNAGKILTIIGKSGSGKSTLAVQIASKIADSHPHSQIIHFDYENATTETRIKTLTKWSDEKIAMKYIHLNQGIYSESLYSMVKAIVKIKLEKFDELKIDSGRVDRKGNTVYILPPTVVLVDSIATMIPKEFSEEEDLSGSMSANLIARTNNAIFKRLTMPCQEGNVILLYVNHITKKISIGPIKESADLNYLGPDETTPGGVEAIYLADTLLRLQASSKLEPEKEFGIKGFMVTAHYAKSRSNSAGKKFSLVFNQEQGFDNFLTNFNYLKDVMKLLKGNGRAYYFDFDPDTKFTQKTVKELYMNNKEWAKKFDELVSDVYYDVLNNSASELDEDTENEKPEFVKWYDEEEGIYLASDGLYYDNDGNEVEFEEE